MTDPTPAIAVSVTITQLIIAALPLVLPVTLTSIASFIIALRNRETAVDAAHNALEAKDRAIEAASKMEEVRVSVDGRLTELIEALHAKAAADVLAAHATGMHLGHLEGRDQANREADTMKPQPPKTYEP